MSEFTASPITGWYLLYKTGIALGHSQLVCSSIAIHSNIVNSDYSLFTSPTLVWSLDL
jgi:uncharacterized membrane protein